MSHVCAAHRPSGLSSYRRFREENRPVFTHILVPVDLTDVYQPALDIAARLAQANDGEVTLLHVVEVISEVWATEDRAFYTRREQTARDHLARLGHSVEAHGVPRRGVDLIVLTSHRIDLEHPAAGWGGVSYIQSWHPRPMSRAPGQMRPARHHHRAEGHGAHGHDVLGHCHWW